MAEVMVVTFAVAILSLWILVRPRSVPSIEAGEPVTAGH
jgi:hypothetical protein